MRWPPWFMKVLDVGLVLLCGSSMAVGFYDGALYCASQDSQVRQLGAILLLASTLVLMFLVDYFYRRGEDEGWRKHHEPEPEPPPDYPGEDPLGDYSSNAFPCPLSAPCMVL